MSVLGPFPGCVQDRGDHVLDVAVVEMVSGLQAAQVRAGCGEVQIGLVLIGAEGVADRTVEGSVARPRIADAARPGAQGLLPPVSASKALAVKT
jgi:hypothetical protein